MGSNMAECHPVAFQWVTEARLRGAKVFHVDPRFTRTSAMTDRHVALRAGSDTAFLGGLVNYVLTHERDFREYVVAYTNAAQIVDADLRLPDDTDGLFSGWDPETRTYDSSSWRYDGGHVRAAAGRPSAAQVAMAPDEERSGSPTRDGESREEETAESEEFETTVTPEHLERGPRDETLQHPRCVYQILKRHYARYTPEFVEETCGVPKEQFLEVAEALCANSGRERTSAFVYSVGWTQHTTGVQYIRAASIVQLLLGNIGRPGGGILALRGHASIQGSTDIPTLYDLLPGYLPMPHAHKHASLAEYVAHGTAQKGFWGNTGAYVTSLLKAWWGDVATADNDFAFGYLPRLTGDHSAYRTTLDMADGKIEGYMLFGQNPAVGSANGRLHRHALAQLDWLVVRDLVEVESASFWKNSPEIASGELRTEDIGTEVFFLPASSHTEKDGTFTNTQRLLQWHAKAVEPKGDCRSDLWFAYVLGLRIREKLRDSTDPKDRPILDLAWDYPTEGPLDEPDAEAVLAEINGHDADGRPLSLFTELRDDGSTACGCWIYCGCYADGVNRPARRTPGRDQSWVAPEWAWAWPDNRRILYNRASADPDGNAWSERKKYVWWDDEQGQWVGEDKADFVPGRPPDYRPDEHAVGVDAIAGDDPFVMQADGKGWLYAPDGLLDGPLPTHYEPHESPVANPLYVQQASPVRQRLPHRLNPDNTPEAYPYVLTTYRIAEHHTAGGMSRFGRRLSELAPELYVEVGPGLAAERGLEHGDWATIVTSRAAVEARVMVTDRMPSLDVGGRRVHQVGLPYHWGYNGTVTGDAANDLLPLALDPNVHISEYKVATCDVRPGRVPRGRALLDLVEHHPRTDATADHEGA